MTEQQSPVTTINDLLRKMFAKREAALREQQTRRLAAHDEKLRNNKEFRTYKRAVERGMRATGSKTTVPDDLVQQFMREGLSTIEAINRIRHSK